MWFLIRTAFWLTLVLALIPLGSGRDTGTGISVDPVAAYFAVKATVMDLSGFCDRNPDACETGGKAISAISTQAQEGAHIVYEFLNSKTDDEAALETAPQEDAPPAIQETEPVEARSAQTAPTGPLAPAGPADTTAPNSTAIATGETGAGLAGADLLPKTPGTLTPEDLVVPWGGGPAPSANQTPPSSPGSPMPKPKPALDGNA
ncbi:DUF5330 domain-containing protein [Roseibium sp. RKSG952]|uniref:DUF5330 domain-containing protein n=1 Tax=Roseibium sp. RKSG952 TaxID=2529384 RepID=UPI0012BCB956|nr:DUF5330 domain-containing protein [Roseibium sp. RKSG952]MTH97284.1 hypothetical protein [Roseibium sp. RKSG952]